MARIRTIKPEFWMDEKISRLPFVCRLFYIGTWNLADDNGVIRGNPEYLKSQIFPYDNNLKGAEVRGYLDTLVKMGKLITLIYDDQAYFIIRHFRKHQKLDPRYANYLIPTGIVEEALESAVMNKVITETTPGTQCVVDECSTQEEEGNRKGKGRGRGRGRGEGNVSLLSNVSSDTVVVDNSFVIDLEGGIVKGGRWREDYSEYLAGLRQVYENLLADESFISEQRRYYPGVDIRLTLEKACKAYWATEAGWKNKRQKRMKTIDWKRTFTNALSQSQNKVYESRGEKDKRVSEDQFDAYRSDILRRLNNPITHGN